MRSLKNKLNEFKQSVHTNVIQYDVIALTETWLDEQVSDSELVIPGYNFFRSDRNLQRTSKCRGGGLLLYIRNSYKCHVLKENKFGVEFLTVVINVHGQNIVFTLTYAPPFENKNSEVYLENITEFVNEMDQTINEIEDCSSIICGDFNLPGYKWHSINEVTLAHGFYPIWQIREAVNLLEKLSNRCQCKQIINETNSAGNCLDLIFTDILDVYYSVSHDPLLSVLDNAHPHPLTTTVSIKNLRAITFKETIYNFHKMNIETMNQKFAEIDWPLILENNLSVDEMTHAFYQKIYSIIDSEVPKIVIQNSSFPPWFDTALKQAVTLKKQLHCKFKESPSEFTYSKFSAQRALCKRLTQTKYQSYLDKIENEIKINPKKFWNYVDIKNAKNRNIPDCVYLNDQKSRNGEETVNLFADHFKQIYTSTPHTSNNMVNVPSSIGNCFDLTPLHTIHISEQSIQNCINELSDKLSLGPDKIPVKFIKSFGDYLIKPLYIIYNKSNKSGKIPALWKTSYVTPVPKKGDKQNVVNYRSIVKNSIFSKMFDSLVETQLSHYLRRTVNCRQHGFMPRRSTCSNLAIYSKYINNNLKLKNQIDSVYTDMRAAFDKVDHDILLQKLERIGVIGNMLKWVESFLKNRKLIVKVKNYESYEFVATTGVPQGSHCGPLLFIFMINDLINNIEHSEILLFADDFKLFKAIKSHDDYLMLQSDLNKVHIWAQNNGFEFNISKCVVITFYKLSYNKHTYFLDDKELVRVESVKDLGIYFDCSLSFEIHIKYIVNKALKKLGFIQRFSRNFRDPRVFLQLYKVLVKPILTYASEIWSPNTNILSYEIEKIQHRFLRAFSYRIGTPMLYNDHNYSDILQKANIPTLESSRKYQDVLFLYKIINSMVDSSELLGDTNWHVPARSLRPTNITFSKESGTNEFLHKNVLTRASMLVNEKLGDIDFNFVSISKFKKLIRIKILFNN